MAFIGTNFIQNWHLLVPTFANTCYTERMIKRYLLEKLISWMKKPARNPLLIRGARQVGKSFLVEAFGRQYFDNFISINFELNPDYKACFASLQPKEICALISAISKQQIVPGKTLLFLDEIQDCPEAIQALRYFKEQMPELHVIGAGSLLELLLKKADFRMPVGRVSSLYLHPISFKEGIAFQHPECLDFLEKTDLDNPMPAAIHALLLKQLHVYSITGGLPEAMFAYHQDENITALQELHANIVRTYEEDFGHYADMADVEHMQSVFKAAPLLIGSQIKYNKINPDVRSRDLKLAIGLLEDALLVRRIEATSANGLPLNASTNSKKFKLNFIDIGLVKRANQLDAQVLLQEDLLLVNKGALAEQFVGQEFMAYGAPFEKPALYFWARDGYGIAEVDYIITVDNHIIPVEVKAGKIGMLRSLKQFISEKKPPVAVRISQAPLSFQQGILSVPLYMVSELPRLIQSCIQKGGIQ